MPERLGAGRDLEAMMMKRRDLLKRLLAGGALLTAKHLAGAPTPVPLLTCAVRGFQYRRGPHLLHRLCVDDVLHLVREPDNEFDENAVAVHWNGEPLGYLPREENRTLAVMLDAGVRLEARISALHPEAPVWAQCEVTVGLVQ
jgi:hypothetical protein